MATGTGVNVSKALAYAVLTPEPGVNVSKALGYAALTGGNVNPPIWPSFTFASGVVSIPYGQTFDLTPAAPPTTYSVASGALPPGLLLTSIGADQGSISGTPTAAGTFSFTLQASNTYGIATQAFSITVVAGGGGGAWTFAA